VPPSERALTGRPRIGSGHRRRSANRISSRAQADRRDRRCSTSAPRTTASRFSKDAPGDRDQAGSPATSPARVRTRRAATVTHDGPRQPLSASKTRFIGLVATARNVICVLSTSLRVRGQCHLGFIRVLIGPASVIVGSSTWADDCAMLRRSANGARGMWFWIGFRRSTSTLEEISETGTRQEL
jgi:hypothetical protein